MWTNVKLLLHVKLLLLELYNVESCSHYRVKIADIAYNDFFTEILVVLIVMSL